MKLNSMALAVVCGAVLVACSARQEDVPAMNDPLAGSRQLIVVRTASWDAMDGTLLTYERRATGSPWEKVGQQSAITLGAKGLAWGAGVHGDALGDGPVKREGDMKSPAGAFRLDAVFGLAGDTAAGRFQMPYIALDSTIECVDDPESRYYNLIVDRLNVREMDWASSEHMQRVGEDYAWGVVVMHNRDPREPGRGSCIFLHIWGSPTKPTEGCTSLEEGRLLEILEWLRPNAQPMLVQLPDSEYERMAPRWGLP